MTIQNPPRRKNERPKPETQKTSCSLEVKQRQLTLFMTTAIAHTRKERARKDCKIQQTTHNKTMRVANPAVNRN